MGDIFYAFVLLPFLAGSFFLLYFSWKSGGSEAHEMYVSKANSSLTGNTLRTRGFVLSCQIKQENILFLMRIEFPTSSMPN